MTEQLYDQQALPHLSLLLSDLRWLILISVGLTGAISLGGGGLGYSV